MQRKIVKGVSVKCHNVDGEWVMTVKQVVEQCRWKEPALRDQIRRGKVKAYRIGPKFLFIYLDQPLILDRLKGGE